MDQEGTTKLQYRSIDKAGNIEELHQQDITIDKTKPDFELTVNGKALKDGETFADYLSAPYIQSMG